MVPVPSEADASEHGVTLEQFVHEHYPHLCDGEYFDVIESAGEC